MRVLLAISDEETPAALPASAGLESMTIQSVVFCGGNHAVIRVRGRANLLWQHTLALQIAARFSAYGKRALALSRTLESPSIFRTRVRHLE